MTDQERLIEDEIYDKLAKKCGKHARCKDCPHHKASLEYGGGCWGKIAIGLIIKARANQKE